MLTVILACAAALLALAACAVMIARLPAATPIIYGASMIVTAISLAVAAQHLLGADPPATRTLPLGQIFQLLASNYHS